MPRADVQLNRLTSAGVFRRRQSVAFKGQDRAAGPTPSGAVTIFVEFNLLDISGCRLTMKNIAGSAK